MQKRRNKMSQGEQSFSFKHESEVVEMPNLNRKRAGAKLSIILLSTLIFLLLFASPAAAVTLGDVTENDAINVQDVVLVMQHILGIADPELTEDQLLAADVNGDDAVNVQDATLIMQYVLGLIDEFPAPDPVDVEVVSVKAIDRTTIEVELEEGVDEDLAADEEEYEVTVDGDAVEVEEVDYDADDDLAVLTVDMEGMSGVLKVNGVEAEDEVPPIPEFISISAVEGSREFTLKFNTPVYEMNTLRRLIDFEVSVGGNSYNIEEIEIAEDAQDAEDEFTIIVEPNGRPAAFQSVLVTIKSSGASRIANIWDESMAELEARSTTAQRDTVNPTFDSITVYDNSTFVVAHFSEPINTTTDDKNKNTGEDILVGSANGRVRVTGFRADGSTLPEFGGTGITAIDRDEEQRSVRIELNRAVPAGAEITVSFTGLAGEKIVDRAKNILGGTYTRTTTALPGPTLHNVEVSNLSAGTPDQEKTFSFTLVGDMDEDEDVRIDLAQAMGKGIDYSGLSGNYTVSGTNGRARLIGGDTIIFEPRDDLPDGTIITVKAEGVSTVGVGSEEDIEVDFIRSEVGSTVTAEFDVLSGLRDVSVDAQYKLQHDDITVPLAIRDVDLLASGQTGHTVTFEFTLSEAMAMGESVDIDLRNLRNAGVSFSAGDPEVRLDGSIDPDVEAEMRTNYIRVTAENNLPEGAEITVTAEGVDVDFDSAAEDLEINFTRSDSGLVFTETIDIEAGFADVVITPINRASDQVLMIEFALDGSRNRIGPFARIDLNALDLNFDFEDAEAEVATSGFYNVNISSTTGVVTFSALSGLIEDGTVVTLEISGVDASNVVEDSLVVLERRPGGHKVVGVLEVDQ